MCFWAKIFGCVLAHMQLVTCHIEKDDHAYEHQSHANCDRARWCMIVLPLHCTCELPASLNCLQSCATNKSLL